MSRFINLGAAIVNADYIIRVETNNNGSAQIYMSDGTMFHCDDFSACDLYGCGHITCLVPCTGIDAVYNSFGKVQHIPVHTLAVNAAGEVYPLHQTDGMGDSADYGQFLGLCERG